MLAHSSQADTSHLSRRLRIIPPGSTAPPGQGVHKSSAEEPAEELWLKHLLSLFKCGQIRLSV